MKFIKKITLFSLILTGIIPSIFGSQNTNNQDDAIDLLGLINSEPSELSYCDCISEKRRKKIADEIVQKIVTNEKESVRKKLKYVTYGSGGAQQDYWILKRLLSEGYSLEASFIDLIYGYGKQATKYAELLQQKLKTCKIMPNQEISVSLYGSTQEFLQQIADNYTADAVVMIDPIPILGYSDLNELKGNTLYFDEERLYLLITEKERKLYSKKNSVAKKEVYEKIQEYLAHPSQDNLLSLRELTPVGIHCDSHIEFLNLVQRIANNNTIVHAAFREYHACQLTQESNYKQLENTAIHRYLVKFLGYALQNDQIKIKD